MPVGREGNRGVCRATMLSCDSFVPGQGHLHVCEKAPQVGEVRSELENKIVSI